MGMVKALLNNAICITNVFRADRVVSNYEAEFVQVPQRCLDIATPDASPLSMLEDPFVVDPGVAARNLTDRYEEEYFRGMRELLHAIELTARRLPSAPKYPEKLPGLTFFPGLLHAVFEGHITITIAHAIVVLLNNGKELAAPKEKC